MHTETGSFTIQYKRQPSVGHDASAPSSSSKGADTAAAIATASLPSGTIDMPLSSTCPDKQEEETSSSSSALTRVFGRLSNAVHGNTVNTTTTTTTTSPTSSAQTFVAQEQQQQPCSDSAEKREPPASPVSTAVGEEDEVPNGFYLNEYDPLNQEQRRRSAKNCLVAMFMITIGTLLALAFILIGLGKALTSAKPDNRKSASITATATTTPATTTTNSQSVLTSASTTIFNIGPTNNDAYIPSSFILPTYTSEMTAS
ncbi:hypothetical protein BDB00DRAFT_873909 [Zychaea mexicana]|uniref:uncharacterized protein n=1 Tax=Zychaea mexicana TaxID=64656 RepID=UPI0022FE9A84|nr:uncharacterized protein BDB00DRAFT_873909 [Zychaea mexicana]KAI9491879.1 hypothetical protein BDB00DRAFT_873909 [Zychaea mexicana]